MFRMNPVRSPRRIAQTANWQVNELMIRRIVAADERQDREANGSPVSGLTGGHCGAFARALK